MKISEMSEEQKEKLFNYDCNSVCEKCFCNIAKKVLRKHYQFGKYVTICYHNIQVHDPLCKKEESLIDIDISKL